MNFTPRIYQDLQFDLTWVAIPKNGVYRAHKIKFSEKGVPSISRRFGDIEGRDFNEYLKNLNDYLLHAKLYRDSWQVEAYDENLGLIGTFQIIETWAKNLETERRENLVIPAEPVNLEVILKHKDKLLAQIAKRKV